MRINCLLSPVGKTGRNTTWLTVWSPVFTTAVCLRSRVILSSLMEAGVCDFSQGLLAGKQGPPDHSEPAYEENSPNLSFQLTAN